MSAPTEQGPARQAPVDRGDDPHPGLSTSWADADRPIPRKVVQPLQRFLSTEVASGVLLLAAAIIALVWANSAFSDSYVRLWETELTLQIGGFELAEDLRHWVNDLLMAFFFFVVGLEVKREFVHGSLRDPKAAALPILCALGGMVVPALAYTGINLGGEAVGGWGIPMATDIAFAVGVLALVGSRAPASLKVFLLTLAVADDIGAIAVIAIFYSDGIEPAALGGAAIVLLAIVAMQRLAVRSFAPYVIAAAVLWLLVFESGVHATIAGVLLGLLTPSRPFHAPEAVAADVNRYMLGLLRTRDGRVQESEEATMLHTSELATEAVSPLSRLEEALHPYTSFVVLPLFALANAGVVLVGGEPLGQLITEPVTLGVLAGLVLGKPLGVLLAGALAVGSKRTKLPDGVGWLELAGVGLLSGIGFTVAIFVAGLAFEEGSALESGAKLGILVASVIAGLIGAGFLALRDDARRHDRSPAR